MIVGQLTDDIIQVTSPRDCVGRVLVKRTKVLAELPVRLDVEGELLSEDCRDQHNGTYKVKRSTHRQHPSGRQVKP